MTPIAANTALVGVDVDLDYWPQGMHVLCEEPALVLCATGAGGGSQQAIFRSDLDPLLARGVERWTSNGAAGRAEAGTGARVGREARPSSSRSRPEDALRRGTWFRAAGPRRA